MSDISRKRGDTYPIVMNVSVDNVALNITGCTFLLTVDPSRAPADDLANVVQLTGAVTNGPAGEVTFDAIAVGVVAVGKYYYDVQMVDTTTFKRTILAGKFIITQDITKD